MRVVRYLLAAAGISLLATNVTFADDRHVGDANDEPSGSDTPKNNSKAGNFAGTSQSDADNWSDKNTPPPSGADVKENSKTGDKENPKTGDAKTTNVRPSTNDDDIVADGPGHKLKKPLIDATKKTTTIGPKHWHWVNGIHHLAAISQRNAVGLAPHQDNDPKGGIVKFGTNGLPGPTASTNITHSGMTKVIDGPPKIDAGLSGKVISHMSPGTGSLGGPVKTTWGTLSGNAFRPKQP
jgi:hypothetical protein